MFPRGVGGRCSRHGLENEVGQFSVERLGIQARRGCDYLNRGKRSLVFDELPRGHPHVVPAGEATEVLPVARLDLGAELSRESPCLHVIRRREQHAPDALGAPRLTAGPHLLFGPTRPRVRLQAKK